MLAVAPLMVLNKLHSKQEAQSICLGSEAEGGANMATVDDPLNIDGVAAAGRLAWSR